MTVNVVVPELGESVHEARIVRWLKHQGDAVTAGEALVELETEKVNFEVGTERAGVLSNVAHKEGDEVHGGDILGVVDEAAAPPPRESAASAPALAPGGETVKAAGAAPAEPRRTAVEAAGGPADTALSPADAAPGRERVVRRVAADRVVDGLPERHRSSLRPRRRRGFFAERCSHRRNVVVEPAAVAAVGGPRHGDRLDRLDSA